MSGELSAQERASHEELARQLSNRVGELLEKPERTRAEVDEMIHAAHASRYHWEKAGTAENLALGEWQISHVYAALRLAEPALYHAQRALDICLTYKIADSPLAYAYEALVRACVLGQRTEDARKYLQLALDEGMKIKDLEAQEQFFNDLATASPGG